MVKTPCSDHMAATMSLSVPKYQPSEIEALTGFGPQQLREWRRLGFLEGFGKLDDNGRWKYSLREAIALAICSQMRGVGLDGGIAIKVAKDFSNMVLLIAQIQASRETPFRYLAIWNNEVLPPAQRQFPLDPLAPFATYKAQDLQEIDHFVNASAPIILDAYKVTTCFPEALTAALVEMKREIRAASTFRGGRV